MNPRDKPRSMANDTASWVEDQTISFDTSSAETVAPDRAHFMRVVKGDRAGECLELGDDPLLLGRGTDSDLRFDDGSVSSRHCSVMIVGTDVIVEDHESTNGTFVDGKRVRGRAFLPAECQLRVGKQYLRYEYRDREEVQQSQELSLELKRARSYVEALLPGRRDESDLSADWCFEPCAVLGGDAFGYHDLDDRHLAIYLVDVCGHGAGSAMHSVTVVNAIRRQTLPGADFFDPGDVLRRLNNVFQMDQHDGMVFSIWYGVYDRKTRALDYASGGHPAALLCVPGASDPRALRTRGLPMGSMPDAAYVADSVPVPVGSSLCVFSDGVFEIVMGSGEDWSQKEFSDLVMDLWHAGELSVARIRENVVRRVGREVLDDDFSLVVLSFH